MGFKVTLLVFAALLAFASCAKLKSGFKGPDQLNPVNSSVTYNESNKIDAAALGNLFALYSSINLIRHSFRR